LELAAIECAHLDTVPLTAAPIRPEWIIAGRPVARACPLSVSSDGTGSSFAWDCTAGSFHWYFGGDELVHILEGEVHVEGGLTRRRLGPGDVALFRAGTWARWHVPVYVRKLAICQDALPRPVSLFLSFQRKVRRLSDRLFGNAVALPPETLRPLPAPSWSSIPVPRQ